MRDALQRAGDDATNSQAWLTAISKESRPRVPTNTRCTWRKRGSRSNRRSSRCARRRPRRDGSIAAGYAAAHLPPSIEHTAV